MKKLFGILLILTLAFSVCTLMAADKAAPKTKTLIPAKTGNVSFDHTSHVKAEKGKCEPCHEKLWPQKSAPINFKAPHAKHEAAKASCGFCHREGGTSFASKGNCTKCHVKGAAKG